MWHTYGMWEDTPQAHLLDKRFPPNIVARQSPLSLELLLHHHLEARTTGGRIVRSHIASRNRMSGMEDVPGMLCSCSPCRVEEKSARHDDGAQHKYCKTHCVWWPVDTRNKTHGSSLCWSRIMAMYAQRIRLFYERTAHASESILVCYACGTVERFLRHLGR